MAIERRRAEKDIASSLEAVPHIVFTESYKKAFDSLSKEEIAEIFITSEVVISDEILSDETIITYVSNNPKCHRCWKLLPEVDQNGELCNRCDSAVTQIKKTL